MKDKLITLLSILTFCIFIFTVPYLLISFQQLNLSFKLWSGNARLSFVIIELISFFLTVHFIIEKD